MTTAIWSGKHGQLGADKQAATWMTVGKIFPIEGQGYLTGAGYYDDLVEVARWIGLGSNEDTKPELPEGEEREDNTGFIFVDLKGSAFWLTTPFLRMVPVTEQYFAVGSGAVPAMAALEAGATVRQALAIACKYDECTGSKYSIVDIPPKVKKAIAKT